MNITIEDRFRKINRIKQQIKTLKTKDIPEQLCQTLNDLSNISELEIPKYIRWTGNNKDSILQFCGNMLSEHNVYEDKDTNEPILFLKIEDFLSVELSIGDILCKENAFLRIASREEIKFISENIDNTKKQQELFNVLFSSNGFCNMKGKSHSFQYVKWDGKNYIKIHDLLRYFYKIINWNDEEGNLVFTDIKNTRTFSVHKGDYIVLQNNPTWNLSYKGPVYLVDIINETEMNRKYIH